MTSGGAIARRARLRRAQRGGAKGRRRAHRDHIGRGPAARSAAAARPSPARALRASERPGCPHPAASQATRWRGTIGTSAVGDEHRAQAEPGCRRGRDARVIRLHTATRDERVGLAGERIGSHEPHLSHLVAAKREPIGIVALDQQAGPPPSAVRSRVISSTGVGSGANGTDGSDASAPNTPL